jgi:hypothetical protein
LEEACRAADITFPRLLARLTPAARALHLVREEGQDGYYEVLGVSPESDAGAIRQAFRRRARELHPDLKPEMDGDHQAFAVLTTAYQTLSDPAAKEAYDSRRQPDGDWFEPGLQQDDARRRRGRFGALIVAVGLLAAVALLFDRLDQEVIRRQAHQEANAVVVRPVRPPAQMITDEPPPTIPPSNTPQSGSAGTLPARSTTALSEPSESAPAAIAAKPSRPPQAPAAIRPSDPVAAPGRAVEPQLAVFYAADRDARLARELADHLSGQGFARPPMAQAAFEQATDIRYFHKADKDRALSLRREVQGFLASASGRTDLPVHLKNLSSRYPRDAAGRLEIWINTRPPGAAAPVARTPAPQPQAAPPIPPAQTEAKIVAFLEDYCQIYESRDPDRLASLFDPGATENGQPFVQLLPRYRSNLARMEQLSYRIVLDHWESQATTETLSVQGHFFAQARRLDQKTYRSQGTIRLDLIPRGDSFRVARLVYEIKK